MSRSVNGTAWEGRPERVKAPYMKTAGSGWYVEEGKAPRSLEPGDVVVIPPNVKHWHGAKKDSWFSHIAVEVPGENTSNEWCKPVTDEEYNNL